MFVLGLVNTGWLVNPSQKNDVYKAFYFSVSRRRTGLSGRGKEKNRDF